MREISRLDNLGDGDPARWGAKAAVLGQLTADGYAVPPGVVIEASRDDITDEEIDTLMREVQSLGDVTVAVRSSSVHEDLPDSAAAGRYTTVLGVRGAHALKSAVRECIASADGSPMAVLVQAQVNATAAGVAFSVNPVTGNPDEALVNAVPGLGDRLVSGELTPDEWTVTDESTRVVNDEITAITATQARDVASLARRIAEDRGTPQDIEWAFSGRQLFLLQARPITTLVEPIPIRLEVPGGYWIRENMHWSAPPTPLSVSVLDLNPYVQQMCARYGLLVDVRMQTIGGWNYMSTPPVGASPAPGSKPRPAPPGWLMPILLRLVPATRRRLRAAQHSAKVDLPGQVMRRWDEEILPRQQGRLSELRDIDLLGLSNLDLADHFSGCVDFLHRSMSDHYEVVMAYFMATTELARVSRDLLGWDFTTVLQLLSGTSTATSFPARALARVGENVRNGEQMADALSELRQEIGLRTITLDLADRTVAESPGLLEHLLADQRDYDPEGERQVLAQQRQQALDEARLRLSGRERQMFDRALDRAQRAYPLRDDNAFHTLESPLAHVRYSALEVGLRMTRDGALAAVDDVFYCELDELLRWLRGGGDDGLRSRVRRRRGERAWAVEHPGPPSYGPHPGGPPPMRWLPTALREPVEAIAFVMGHVAEPELSNREEPAETGRLTGIGASAGAYTGPARIVRSEAEFHRIRRGDVLVCPSTRPSWAIVFPSLGALVTDVGGALAHPAIIAREHRIPAVVGTGCSTTVLSDGQMVTVDGAAGVVTYDATGGGESAGPQESMRGAESVTPGTVDR
ncbi:MAG: PEP/pyruvate-binding domain-containing protein [Mycetocola sp.]